MKKAISLFAAASLLAACAQQAQSPIAEQSFTIFELNGTELVQYAEEPSTISFVEDRCCAYVGGNQIFAFYEEGEQGALSFKEGGATKMAVPEEIREDEFLEAFCSIASYSIENDVISFLDENGTVLFRAVK